MLVLNVEYTNVQTK